MALKETDGTLEWHNLDVPFIGDAKISQGRIISQVVHNYDAYHTATGAKETLPFPGGKNIYPSLFVSLGDNFYSADTSIYGYDVVRNKVIWEQPYGIGGKLSPLLADSKHLFTYSWASGKMLVHRISDGTFVKELQAKNGRMAIDYSSSMMIANDRLVWLDPNDYFGRDRAEIYSISVGNPDDQWKIKAGNVYSNFATGGNKIYYMGDYSTLKAISAVDGSPLWSTEIPEQLDFSHGFPGQAFQILAVGNMIFVSSQADEVKQTYAIDRSTGKIVWSLPASGAMAVSENGNLFISRFAFDNTEPWKHAVFAISLH